MSRKVIYHPGDVIGPYTLIERVSIPGKYPQWRALKKGKEILVASSNLSNKKTKLDAKNKELQVEQENKKIEFIDKFKNINDGVDDIDFKVMVELMNLFPDSRRYIKNKMKLMFGDKYVYACIIEFGGVEYIKVGYSWKTARQRIEGEKRYKGKVNFVRDVQLYSLQALGAVEMESKLKSVLVSEGFEFAEIEGFEAPGKGECLVYSEKTEETVIQKMQELYSVYENVKGLAIPK